MKKDVEIREIRRKTLKNGSPKDASENINKVKNVDEQQDAIQHLKE